MTNRCRRGLTLVELLVVVSILVVLLAVMVPIMQPILQGQDTREAARQVNVFFAGAQAQAIALGRPVGVWIERFGHEPNEPPERWYTSFRLYLAEQPPPYAGDIYDARVIVAPNPWRAELVDPDTMQNCCLGARLLVRPGDFIQFDQRGPLYPVLPAVTAGTMNENYTLSIPFFVSPTAPYHKNPIKHLNRFVPFRVIRQPIKTSSQPLELPNQTAIDLSLSGYGSLNDLTRFRGNGNFPLPDDVILPDEDTLPDNFVTPEHDIVIMFSPKGGVERIYYIAHEPDIQTFVDENPTGLISLFIGRGDKIGRDVNNQPNLVINGNDLSSELLRISESSSLGEANLEDKTNIWVNIDTRTGRVSNAQNFGFVNSLTAPLPVDQDLRIFVYGGTDGNGNFVSSARQLATTGQSMGGR